MSSRSRRAMAALALAGLAAAAVSTYVHAQILGDPAHVSFCDVNARINCSDAYQSRYGSVAGVPVALGGMIWFVGVLLLALASARAPAAAQENVNGYLLVWSTIGLAVAMYMAYASFVVLQTVCLLCLVVYAAVIGIFVLSGSGSATPVRRLPAAAAADLARLARHPAGLALAVVWVAASVGSAAWFVRADQVPVFTSSPAAVGGESASATGAALDNDQSEFERFWREQPRVDFTLPAARPQPEAPVVVVKFNDYECPACARSERNYAPIFAKYEASHPGAVALVTLDFPLDPECNEHTPQGRHEGACEAAAAVRLAAEAGPEARRRMEAWLYDNQESLTRERIVAALEDLAGVRAADFEARYAAEIESVQLDIASGAALPLRATPTYIVNGVVLEGGIAPRFFDAALAWEIARSAAP